MKSLKLLLGALLLAGLAGCSGQPATEGDKTADDAKTTSTAKAEGGAAAYEIAVIPKGTTHPFWKTVHAGAAKAAQEFNVKINWVGAENEDDRNQQIALVQNFISKNVDAIVLAPLDDTALVSPVNIAISRQIPVVIFDSGLKSDKINSFVATDNFEGGKLGARRLAEVMGDKGKALLLRYNVGSDSTTKREEGFLEEMKNHPNIQLVSTDQYAGVTKESALQISQNLLNKFPDIEGAFASNESAAYGMWRALTTSGKAQQVKFVGFDTSADLLTGLKKGEIQGLVSQDPFDMGYQGVKAAVEVLQKKQIAKRIPTRLMMVTPENMDKPEVKEVTQPDIEKWLK